MQAYQNWKKRRGRPEPNLPGMKDFTNEQIFFLGFAQVCRSFFRNKIKNLQKKNKQTKQIK